MLPVYVGSSPMGSREWSQTQGRLGGGLETGLRHDPAGSTERGCDWRVSSDEPHLQTVAGGRQDHGSKDCPPNSLFEQTKQLELAETSHTVGPPKLRFGGLMWSLPLLCETEGRRHILLISAYPESNTQNIVSKYMWIDKMCEKRFL